MHLKWILMAWGDPSSYVTHKILSGRGNEGGHEESVVAEGWHCHRYYMPPNLASIWAQAWQMCGDVSVLKIEMEQLSLLHTPPAIDLSSFWVTRTAKNRWPGVMRRQRYSHRPKSEAVRHLHTSSGPRQRLSLPAHHQQCFVCTLCHEKPQICSVGLHTTTVSGCVLCVSPFLSSFGCKRLQGSA